MYLYSNTLYNVVARMANKYFHTCQTEIFVVMAKGKLIIICHVTKELHGAVAVAEAGDTTLGDTHSTTCTTKNIIMSP